MVAMAVRETETAVAWKVAAIIESIETLRKDDGSLIVLMATTA